MGLISSLQAAIFVYIVPSVDVSTGLRDVRKWRLVNKP